MCNKKKTGKMQSVFQYLTEAAQVIRGRNKKKKKNDDERDHVSSLDTRVRDYIKGWDMDVSQKLECAKLQMLMERKPLARARMKTNIETLSAVLDLLRGKRQEDPPMVTRHKEEIARLKERLRDLQCVWRKDAEHLYMHKKMVRDFKFQLNELYEKQKETERTAERTKDLLRQLREFQVSSASKLSQEFAINIEHMQELRETHMLLRQQRKENMCVSEDYVDI